MDGQGQALTGVDKTGFDEKRTILQISVQPAGQYR